MIRNGLIQNISRGGGQLQWLDGKDMKEQKDIQNGIILDIIGQVGKRYVHNRNYVNILCAKH